MGKVTSFNGIEIVVRTRDEHCEPHVHAFHMGEGWELRIYFSFVTPQIVEVELYHGITPREKVVQACMNRVVDMLDKVRRLYWEAVQTVCLDNKFVAIVNGEIRPSNSKSPGALRVKAARYDVKKKSVEVTAQGLIQPIVGKCP